jgi:UDP-2,3-diacylglucosamine pyrophosphatase LpxH
MAELAWSRERTGRLPGHPAPTPLARRHSYRTGPLEPPRPVRRHRTIFISDVHLGTRGCKAELLGDFLARNSCETLYLVGDIVDGWRLRRRWFWPESHNRVVEILLHKIDTGTRVIYVPGNHDEVLRPHCGRIIAGIEMAHESVHETADGRRLLVLHGDRFDTVIACAKWFVHLGDWAYTLALELNEFCHAVRRGLGLPYWSLSAYLKRKVKNALEYICRFETAVAREARSRGFDGVVCGHIHQATIKTIESVLYINDGDWVESCTALVEDMRGHLEIVCWASADIIRRPVMGPVSVEPAAAVPA